MSLFVFGAGGHGKFVCDILLSANKKVVAFIDDAKRGTVLMGIPVISHAEWVRDARTTKVALGVGDNLARQRVASSCVDAGATLFSAIHPRAVISPFAKIGTGVVVGPLAVVNVHAQVED